MVTCWIDISTAERLIGKQFKRWKAPKVTQKTPISTKVPQLQLVSRYCGWASLKTTSTFYPCSFTTTWGLVPRWKLGVCCKRLSFIYRNCEFSLRDKFAKQNQVQQLKRCQLMSFTWFPIISDFSPPRKFLNGLESGLSGAETQRGYEDGFEKMNSLAPILILHPCASRVGPLKSALRSDSIRQFLSRGSRPSLARSLGQFSEYSCLRREWS